MENSINLYKKQKIRSEERRVHDDDGELKSVEN